MMKTKTITKRYDVWVYQVAETWETPGERKPFYAHVHQHPFGDHGLWSPLDKTKRFRTADKRRRWLDKMTARFQKATYSRLF